ncbi:MAG: isochorismatase family protein [Verrucomicrobiota bacterium]
MSWRFTFERSLVLVIDMQERIVPAVSNADWLLNQAIAFIRVARMMQMQTVVTQQVPEKLGNTVAPLLALLHDVPPKPKTSFSAADALAWRIPNDVIILGVETHVCVRQTAFDFLEQDKRVTVLADAVSSISPHDHHLGLEEMRRRGVRVTSMQALVTEMLGDAHSPGFAEVLGILKEHASSAEG